MFKCIYVSLFFPDKQAFPIIPSFYPKFYRAPFYPYLLFALKYLSGNMLQTLNNFPHSIGVKIIFVVSFLDFHHS